jgi:hypothetical protein
MNPRFYRNTIQKKVHPQGNGALELRAADIAQRNGATRVKNEHRKQASQEMQSTSPKTPDDEPASH